MLFDVINGEQLIQFETPNSTLHGYSERDNTSILEALNNFYAAFNQRDVDKSISNWAQQDYVVMSNPMGGIRRGIQSIQQGYQSIMQGRTQVYVEFYDYELVESDEISYVAGRERGYAQRGDVQLDLDIRTSRIFQRLDGQWKQIHHHGSMTDAKALQQYQEFLNTSG